MKKLFSLFAFFLLLSANAQQNLIDTSTWVAQQTTTPGGFSLQGDASHNSRVDIAGPFTTSVVAWQASSNNTSATAFDGGWSHSGASLDTGKLYRFSVWMRSTGPNNCANQAGYVPYNSAGVIQPTYRRLDNSTTQWPQFFNSPLPNDKWYLVVGYIHPNGGNGANLGGVYDPQAWDPNNPNNLPNPTFTTTDYKFPASESTVSIRMRNFMYGCTLGDFQYSFDPRLEEVNGQEPSVLELLVDSTPPPPTGNAVWNTSGSGIFYDQGNVGIGATDPLEKLHLQSGKFLIKSTQNTNNAAHNSGLRFTTDVNSRAAEILIRRGSSSQQTGMQFNTYSGGTLETMTLLNGQVGIGTTAPDAPLAVKGRIHAEEVKVDLSVPGPDYVFKADYELRTLEEIRKYIAAHGHLPNIPAAKEMEEKGIDLGTMNMKLLEKIEELTLYILEQEDNYDRLKKRLEEMDEKIKNLR